MKHLILFLGISILVSCSEQSTGIPECYSHVDQVLWVVSDMDAALEKYKELGFSQFADMGATVVVSEKVGAKSKIRWVRANLGGAHINWIQPLDGDSRFHEFQKTKGDGAMSLVHRFTGKKELNSELKRLAAMKIDVVDKVTISADDATVKFVLMNTAEEGKYTLGFTYGDEGGESFGELLAENRHSMKLNQYAFAIRDPDPVSAFWKQIGLPELEIRYPELGDPKYYGEVADHELIQGWQRHGTIAYEWCIPVKPPIVYEDHIQLHGEGIHHLAFSVDDMDQVLDDFTSRGFVVSMGGTWGETGQPGSGRYEYIDLEEAGGLTMELLWNYKD